MPWHLGLGQSRLLKCEPHSVGSAQRGHMQSKNHFSLRKGRRIEVGLSAFMYWLVIWSPSAMLVWAITWILWSALITVLVLQLQ